MYENVISKTNESKKSVLARNNVKGNEAFQFKVKQKVYKKCSSRNKNKPKFSGPYEIIEILDHNRVKLKNFKYPDKTEIVHVKELKKPLVTDGPSYKETA